MKLAVLAGVMFCGIAYAASGSYELDWDRADEILVYRSCGCADSCWVAEVQHRKSRKPLARLRCDCEQSYYSLANQAEQLYQPSCAQFEDDKMANIARTLRQLMQ